MKKNFALGKSLERMSLSEKNGDKNIDEKIVGDKNDVGQKEWDNKFCLCSVVKNIKKT